MWGGERRFRIARRGVRVPVTGIAKASRRVSCARVCVHVHVGGGGGASPESGCCGVWPGAVGGASSAGGCSGACGKRRVRIRKPCARAGHVRAHNKGRICFPPAAAPVQLPSDARETCPAGCLCLLRLYSCFTLASCHS